MPHVFKTPLPILRLITPFLFLAFAPSVAQTKEFRDQIFSEMLSVIEHPFEFLGKTDSSIMAKGRPATMLSGDVWIVTLRDSLPENSMEASKVVIIGTGRAGMMLLVSQQTGLVYNLTYLPSGKAKIKGADIIKFLNRKYKSCEQGTCLLQTKDDGKIGLMIGLPHALTIIAVSDDGGTVKFSK